MRAIVAISGGIDSAVAAKLASLAGYELYFLTVNYGQKNWNKEFENAKFFSCFLKAKEHKVIDMKWLGELGKSGITDSNVEFDGVDKDREYVPFRNTCILSAAVAWAETMTDVEKIYVGSMTGPWICPDNSPKYYELLNNLIKEATKTNKRVEIIAPLNYMDKPQIIKKALEIDIPLEHTWTCVANNNKACGICPPCKNRKESFKNLNINDPIEYEE